MNHMTTAQAELLLRLADLLDEMEEENIEISQSWDGDDYCCSLSLDGVGVLAIQDTNLTGDDIRSITA